MLLDSIELKIIIAVSVGLWVMNWTTESWLNLRSKSKSGTLVSNDNSCPDTRPNLCQLV